MKNGVDPLIPKGGLEIVLLVSIHIEDERYLERLKEIITANYQDPEGQESLDLSNSIQTSKIFTMKRKNLSLKMMKINKMKLYD